MINLPLRIFARCRGDSKHNNDKKVHNVRAG